MPQITPSKVRFFLDPIQSGTLPTLRNSVFLDAISKNQFKWYSNYYFNQETNFLPYELDELITKAVASLNVSLITKNCGNLNLHKEQDISYTYISHELLCMINYSSGGSFGLHLASTLSEDHLIQAKNTILEIIPPSENASQNNIYITFTNMNGNGLPDRYRRDLSVPSWDEVKLNYTQTTYNAITDLSSWTPDQDLGDGKLILFWGPPGTGKTTMIRMLAKQWSEWANLIYVIDPDAFFRNASYMTALLMQSQSSNKWRILILEDTDELISEEAKQKKDQSFSRLLNLCDGMIGQGLKTLIILTTNETLENLHPAIIRPGRCKANIEIGLLNRDEAAQWRQAHNLAEPSDAPEYVSLAQLYEELNHSSKIIQTANPVEKKKFTIGFTSGR